MIGENSNLHLAVHGVLSAFVCAFVLLLAAMLSGMAGDPAGDSRARASVKPAVVRPGPPAPRAVHAAPPRAFESPLTLPTQSGGREARLAIVIDDIGHNLEVLQDLLSLNRPLTFAVLPALEHSRRAAHLIESAGREFLIHLPMEPFAYPVKDPGPVPLLLSLNRRETARRVRGYIENLPGAMGASNHMGSAYTHDEERMEVVQTVLAENRLFFLNSRTSGALAPGRVARRWGYRYLERDVFLDHDPDPPSIRRAFGEVVRRARNRGRAVAIGHPYPETIAVLRANLPRLNRQGVRLVSLSSLLDGPPGTRTAAAAR